MMYMFLVDLKKVSLKGLDKMPKVTDLLFSKVLAKMKLNELVLTADKPLEKVLKKNNAFVFLGFIIGRSGIAI